MIRRPPRSTLSSSSAASDVYKRQKYRYKENLPNGCPPVDSCSSFSHQVIRLVDSPEITLDDFKSHAALGIAIRGDITPCRWASCSVFISGQVAKLPRLK